jgi:hypothetical protein
MVAKFVKVTREPYDQPLRYKALEQATYDTDIIEWWLGKKLDFPGLFPVC